VWPRLARRRAWQNEGRDYGAQSPGIYRGEVKCQVAISKVGVRRFVATLYDNDGPTTQNALW
jgi:hypothetical protein